MRKRSINNNYARDTTKYKHLEHLLIIIDDRNKTTS
ncbi:hypothetical protein DSUL_40039 [Desulfovibrionales bacterium]